MTEHARSTGRLVAAWDGFWFQVVPPDSYALLRILFGTLGILGLLGLIPVSTFWTPEGLIPLPGGGSGFRAQLYSLGLGPTVGWAVVPGALPELPLHGARALQRLGRRPVLCRLHSADLLEPSAAVRCA